VKGVILVGGEGTRLRPLTLQVQKSMVPMAGRPFLEYQLSLLRKHGVREVVLSLCHLPDRIRRHFGRGERFGVRLHYAQEREPLGTAGAIKNAQPHLSGSAPVVVFNGDILTDMDISRMLEEHRRHRALITMSLTQVPDPSAFGLVQLARGRRIVNFLEKPKARRRGDAWINAGVYVFEPAVLDHIPAGRKYSAERELFPGLLAAGERIWGYTSRDYWTDIGTLARYLRAHQDILEGRMFLLPTGRPAPGRAGVRLGRRCRIHRTARVRGPAILGEACVLGREARVGGLAVLGRRVRLGFRAAVERSVLWDGVSVGDHAELNGCVVGPGCRIGAHASVRAGSVLGAGTVLPPFSQA